MRVVAQLLLALFFSGLSFGQVPNAGFENWVTDPDSNRNPVGWETTNSFPSVSVEPVSPGCRGDFAMKVKTVDLGLPFPGIALLTTGYPFSQTPKRFSACVKSSIMPGDQAFIIVALMKGDSIIASMDSCTFKIDSSYNQFTTLEFPIAIQSSLVPDSLLVMVASGLGSGVVGTEVIVDELTFQTGVSTTVLESRTIPGEFSVHQNYPNPFNPSTTIRYALPEASIVRLVVYDLLGRAVAVLAEGTKQAGLHETVFDAAGLPSGVYFYRLQAGGFAATKKLALTK